MKWAYFIIIIMLGGGFAWWWFNERGTSQWGTPAGVAQQFVTYATSGDSTSASFLCAPELQEQATQIAQAVDATGFDAANLSLDTPEVSGSDSSFGIMINGQVLSMVVTDNGEGSFQITQLQF